MKATKYATKITNTDSKKYIVLGPRSAHQPPLSLKKKVNQRIFSIYYEFIK